MTTNRHPTTTSDDVVSIVPERTLQQIADDHGYSVDSLRAAVREDLPRNRRMAGEILDHRKVVDESDDYLVLHASEAVSTETAMSVLSVYEQMDDSGTDWIAGYPLVVPTIDDADECPYEVELESAVDRWGDDR